MNTNTKNGRSKLVAMFFTLGAIAVASAQSDPLDYPPLPPMPPGFELPSGDAGLGLSVGREMSLHPHARRRG